MLLLISIEKIIRLFQKVRSINNTMSEQYISIIMPVYNGGAYLSESIESVLKQTYKNIELIIVDDCSTDNSLKVIKKYEETDRRIVLLRNCENKGLSYTREKGFQASSARWIMFVDQDDVVAPNICEILLEAVSSKDDIDVAYCNLYNFNESENIVDNWFNDVLYNEWVYEDGRDCVKSYFGINTRKGCCSNIWGKIIRREILEKIDYEKGKKYCPLVYFEDCNIVPRMYFEARKVVYVPNVLYAYRINNSSVSHSVKNMLYFYNQVNSGRLNYKWLKNIGMEKEASESLECLLLGIMKTYYSARLINNKQYMLQMSKVFNSYYNIYCFLPKCYKNRITNMQVDIFNKSNRLYCVTVGNLYFRIISNQKLKNKLAGLR
jgi:glycosyltransferase involved in cell wall biosynthesis